MLSLPDGFDFSVLVSDYFSVGALVVGVCFSIVAARIIIRSLKG